ncbi:hypothetical protein OG206_00820 [Streptomyces sp. NBC_01341]|uniref:hypothetical protein n=1 Tax=Streptomyces sp. NBC_01341 TaxID=2903831 RepID=UPI002E0D56C0|nr:hypothetical protein OG206_00820 [Streptomyces sp. NBC_01341]
MTYETGLAWLSEQCDDLTELRHAEMDCLIDKGPASAILLITERSVRELGHPASLQLSRDVRRLLDSGLSDDTIRTAWVGSTDHALDPAKQQVGAREWLERIESTWLAAESARDPGFTPPAAEPVTDEALRAAAHRAIAPAAAALTRAHEEGEVFNPLPLPGPLVPALEQVITGACADLGFRLFLRAVKRYVPSLDGPYRAALAALGERLSHPESAVDPGLQRD